jgi:hypothetical protein
MKYGHAPGPNFDWPPASRHWGLAPHCPEHEHDWPRPGSGSGDGPGRDSNRPGLPTAGGRSGTQAQPGGPPYIRIAAVPGAVRAGETENRTDSVSALELTLVSRGSHVEVPPFARSDRADRDCGTPSHSLR